jgi:hypothetical protein
VNPVVLLDKTFAGKAPATVVSGVNIIVGVPLIAELKLTVVPDPLVYNVQVPVLKLLLL